MGDDAGAAAWRVAGLNDEGRAVVLTIIETGARPSEICNLTEQVIKLGASVPLILIEPRLDPDDPREIKPSPPCEPCHWWDWRWLP